VGEAGADIGKDWAEQAIAALRPKIPRVTGKTQESLHVEPAAGDTVRIVGSPVILILDEGAKAHPIVANNAQVLRWSSPKGPVFRARADHPQLRGRHFRGAAAAHALEDVRMDERVVRKWNEAA
jgi:hypothetical protein